MGDKKKAIGTLCYMLLVQVVFYILRIHETLADDKDSRETMFKELDVVLQ